MSAHTLKEMAAIFGAAPDLYEAMKDVTVTEKDGDLYVAIDSNPYGWWAAKVPREFEEVVRLWQQKRDAAIAKAEGRT